MDIKSLINHQPHHGCTQDTHLLSPISHRTQDFKGLPPQTLDTQRFWVFFFFFSVFFATLFIKKKKLVVVFLSISCAFTVVNLWVHLYHFVICSSTPPTLLTAQCCTESHSSRWWFTLKWEIFLPLGVMPCIHPHAEGLFSHNRFSWVGRLWSDSLDFLMYHLI